MKWSPVGTGSFKLSLEVLQAAVAAAAAAAAAASSAAAASEEASKQARNELTD